jgi:hypothetical protein
VIKTSVLFFYHELFPSDRFRIVIFCVMGFIGMMTIACIPAFMFECTPIHAYWTLPVMDPKRDCVNGGALLTASSALSLVTDVVVLVMPIKYLIGMLTQVYPMARLIVDIFRALRISTRERIQVIVLMSLGCL